MSRPPKYHTLEEIRTAQRDAARRFSERHPGHYSKKKKGKRTTEERARDDERREKMRGTKSTRFEPPPPHTIDEDRRRVYEQGPSLARCKCGTWTTARPCQQCRIMDAEEWVEVMTHRHGAREENRMAYGDTERLLTFFNRGESDLVDLIEKYIPPPILDGRESEEE